MAIPYVVRKKADLTSGERKELWYGVPSKIQDRGGVQNKELAQVVELRGGFHRGPSLSLSPKLPTVKSRLQWF